MILALHDAVAALLAGRVVGMPTDTLYGIAAHPQRREAVEELYDLKGRSEDQAIGLLVTGIEQALTVAEFDPVARRLAGHHWPGPLTLVLPRRPGLAGRVGDPVRDTVGVRAPAHPVALELLGHTGPLAVTSANRSGEPAAVDHEGAAAVFGNRIAGYLEGRATVEEGSTVVDLTTDPPTILRAGPVEP